MRVVLANRRYHVAGGAERYIELLEGLLQRRGHDPIPFAMADARNRPSEYSRFFVTNADLRANSPARPARWKAVERVIYSREARRKMMELIRFAKPDLAHLHNIYHYLSPSIIDALSQSGVPTVMTLHDYKLVCPVQTLWNRGHVCDRCAGSRFYECVRYRCKNGWLAASVLVAAEAYIHTRIARTYDGVDLFIAPSRFLRDRHIANGIQPSRIVHIPNFVDVTRYSPCPDSDGYIAFVGRLTQTKGLNTLLRALARMQDPPRLLVVGKGPMRGAAQELVGVLGLSCVDFVGFRSGEELRKLMARARCVVVPSEWYENCPYAILEAFALATPVVASDIGGIPELVEDGVNGLLSPAGDVGSLAEALGFFAHPSARLSAMRRAARETAVELYGAEMHAERLSSAYSRAGAGSI